MVASTNTATARPRPTALVRMIPVKAKAPVPGHLTPSGVASIASEAGVHRVILTHIYPAADELNLLAEVGRGYAGEVIVAEDGLEFEV